MRRPDGIDRMRRAFVGAGLAGVVSAATGQQPTIEQLELNDGSRLELQFEDGLPDPARRAARAATERAAAAVTGYFGRFPRRELELLFVAAEGRGVMGGTTFAEPEPYIRLRLGRGSESGDLDDDWVLAHEMVHLALPRVKRPHRWFHEGVATYVEGVARVGAGQVEAGAMWHGFARGLRHGLPGAGDLGLDRTPTWGRTYWGGALFCLLADVESRRRGASLGLQQGLRGVLAAGGSYAVAWPLAQVIDTADAAIGAPILRELHALLGACPAPIDLAALLGDLGVDAASELLDDSAPLAAIRRAIAG